MGLNVTVLGRYYFSAIMGKLEGFGTFLGSSVLKRKKRNQKVEIFKKPYRNRRESLYQRTPMH